MPNNNREKVSQLLAKMLNQSELEVYLKGLKKLNDTDVEEVLLALHIALHTTPIIAKQVREILKRHAMENKT